VWTQAPFIEPLIQRAPQRRAFRRQQGRRIVQRLWEFLSRAARPIWVPRKKSRRMNPTND
jgi:hypothetical protein